jgi:hypothetical protein
MASQDDALRPEDYERCAECFHTRWYHRMAEALGEIDHPFKPKESQDGKDQVRS